ncbi:MAG TPA: glutamyl-tRNA reductase [Gemmatimonadaceae bacterium]|nr:glutamyl-tRNA reductase [Gemmatimonadaceae bacterium]
MALTLIGVSHRTAPIELRERLAVSAHELPGTLALWRAAAGAHEGVLLSTCNRTELYLADDDADSVTAVWRAWSQRLGTDAAPHGYVRREREAVTHLYRVAAGLDSMILGEAQIHGQVRDAWELSRGEAGTVLNRLFQSALHVAGRVRAETTVTRGAASVSSAAVQLAKKIFGTLQGRRAMVLGAGEMAELALECLVDEGVRAALVANRTYARAEALAARHGATVLHYDACWDRLHEVDLLLCSTSSPHPVVTVERVSPALARRGDEPLCVLDIALPRDVDARVGALDNVYLYDLDDLRAVVTSNIERRRSALPTAEALIAAEVEQYWSWLAGLSAVPVLRAWRSQMEHLRDAELARTLRRLEHLSDDDRRAIEHFSRALMNKFLHEPSVRLRAAAANGKGLAIVDALRDLFGVVDTAGATPSAGSAAPGGARDDAQDGARVRSRERSENPTGASPAAQSAVEDVLDREPERGARGATDHGA